MTTLSLCLATMLLGTNFSATAVPDRQTADISASYISQAFTAEQQMLNLVNSERWSRNLTMYRYNPELSQVARAHSQEMANMGYFDHISPIPELRTPMKRYLHYLGYTPSYACIGENLYYCSRFNVGRGHRALMNSPSHRDNILSDRYDEIGIGCYIAQDGSFWVTELFLTQID